MTSQHAKTEIQRYPLKARTLSVVRIEELSATMRRIILSGEDMEASLPFGDLSPADHVKLSIPDPQTGEVRLPTFDDGGMQRPEGVALREYTIRSFDRESRELAIDFVLHDHGPAGQWAISAKPGDKLGVMGPRGSQIYPDTYSRYVLAADETALPAAERWLESAPSDASIDLFISIDNPDSVRELPAHPGASIHWLRRDSGEELSVAVIEALPNAEDNTFIWAAAEASSLIPLRRHVRELGVAKNSVDIRGYWKLSESEYREASDNHDHKH